MRTSYWNQSQAASPPQRDNDSAECRLLGPFFFAALVPCHCTGSADRRDSQLVWRWVSVRRFVLKLLPAVQVIRLLAVQKCSGTGAPPVLHWSAVAILSTPVPSGILSPLPRGLSLNDSVKIQDLDRQEVEIQ